MSEVRRLRSREEVADPSGSRGCVRIAGAHRIVSKPQPFDYPTAKILDENVSAAEEIEYAFPIRRILEICRNPQFIYV